MIPKPYIARWKEHVSWTTNEQVEQDLIISRTLVELFGLHLLIATFAPVLKILSAILSVYILALSVMPCADGIDSAQDQVHQEMMADHDHSGHEHPPGEDLCTPLCACQCCHTSITFSAPPNLEDSPLPEQQHTSLYSEHSSRTFQSPLLHPPQV